MELNSTEQSHQERVENLLKENQRLLIENNALLRSMRRRALLSSVLRFVWFLFLLGAGFYVYYTHIQPNLAVIEARITELSKIVPDQAALKGLYNDIRSPESSAE